MKGSDRRAHTILACCLLAAGYDIHKTLAKDESGHWIPVDEAARLKSAAPPIEVNERVTTSVMVEKPRKVRQQPVVSEAAEPVTPQLSKRPKQQQQQQQPRQSMQDCESDTDSHSSPAVGFGADSFGELSRGNTSPKRSNRSHAGCSLFWTLHQTCSPTGASDRLACRTPWSNRNGKRKRERQPVLSRKRKRSQRINRCLLLSRPRLQERTRRCPHPSASLILQPCPHPAQFRRHSRCCAARLRSSTSTFASRTSAASANHRQSSQNSSQPPLPPAPPPQLLRLQLLQRHSSHCTKKALSASSRALHQRTTSSQPPNSNQPARSSPSTQRRTSHSATASETTANQPTINRFFEQKKEKQKRIQV